jgi:hypothetical protein
VAAPPHVPSTSRVGRQRLEPARRIRVAVEGPRWHVQPMDPGPAWPVHTPDVITMPSASCPAPSQIVPKIPKPAGESGFGHKNDGHPRGATVLSRRRSGKHPMTHCAPTKCSPRGGRRPWGSTLGVRPNAPTREGGVSPHPSPSLSQVLSFVRSSGDQERPIVPAPCGAPVGDARKRPGPRRRG